MSYEVNESIHRHRLKHSIVAIETREDLLAALDIAGQFEHALMCEYLFAVLSLKRSTSEGVSDVDLEKIRRWGAGVMLVARQEMEHLGLVLNLRSALGEQPSLLRPSFPQRKSEYEVSDIRVKVGGVLTELTLAPFRGDVIERFRNVEAPDEMAGIDCSTSSNEARSMADMRFRALDQVEVEAKPFTLDGSSTRVFEFKSIQDLYVSIYKGLEAVQSSIGPEALFVGPSSAQVWGGPGSAYEKSQPMNDLNQYGIDLIEVKDLKSAQEAVKIILQQGEGLYAPPAYVKFTHYCIFERMLGEVADFERRGVAIARPVVENPRVARAPEPVDYTINLITHPATLKVAALFNECYDVMLRMLLALYGDWDKTAQETQGLTDAVFFPLMTMFIRPLGELLTWLPAFEGDQEGTAGPSFELSEERLSAPEPELLWEYFKERLEKLKAGFEALPYDAIRAMSGPPPDTADRLRVMSADIARLSLDWNERWENIGRRGASLRRRAKL